MFGCDGAHFPCDRTQSRTMVQTRSLQTAIEAIAQAARGGRVFLTAGPSEPVTLHDAWAQAPDLAGGLTFCGLFLPGINTRDYSRLAHDAIMEAPMASPDWRAGVADGRVRVAPLHYSQSFARLLKLGADAGVFMVSPPDREGMVSFGPSADIGPAMLARTGFKLALINARMPAFLGAPRAALGDFSACLEIDAPLTQLPAPQVSSDMKIIAANAAAFVRDGDTIQTGIGRLPGAILQALRAHADLRSHSGLLGAGHFDLLDAGVIAPGAGSMVAGVILGDEALYARAALETCIALADVATTHAPTKAPERFIALNAALEVDLFGQINAEYAGAQWISGVGGLTDFIRLSRASPGGRAIVAVQARGKGGISRIVGRLNVNSVTVARADAPIIVTEFGGADLSLLDTQARARALINIAPPEAQDALRAEWMEMGSGL
jgi:acyl-CoA hydrolase